MGLGVMGMGNRRVGWRMESEGERVEGQID